MSALTVIDTPDGPGVAKPTPLNPPAVKGPRVKRNPPSSPRKR